MLALDVGCGRSGLLGLRLVFGDATKGFYVLTGMSDEEEAVDWGGFWMLPARGLAPYWFRATKAYPLSPQPQPPPRSGSWL